MSMENTFATIADVSRTVEAVARYLEVVNNKGDDITISAIPKCDGNVITFKFRGHCGETWQTEAWIGNNGELHLENANTRQDVFLYAYEYGWTKEEVQYMKFGK